MTELQLRRILLPAEDVAAAVAFLADHVGLTPRFVDADRYAELDATAGLAVIAPADHPVPGRTALMVKADDVDLAVDALVAAGAELLAAPAAGAHERRAAVSVPGSAVAIVVYATA